MIIKNYNNGISLYIERRNQLPFILVNNYQIRITSQVINYPNVEECNWVKENIHIILNDWIKWLTGYTGTKWDYKTKNIWKWYE